MHQSFLACSKVYVQNPSIKGQSLTLGSMGSRGVTLPHYQCGSFKVPRFILQPIGPPKNNKKWTKLFGKCHFQSFFPKEQSGFLPNKTEDMKIYKLWAGDGSVHRSSHGMEQSFPSCLAFFIRHITNISNQKETKREQNNRACIQQVHVENVCIN